MGLRRVLNLDLIITNEPRGFYGAEARAFLVKKPGESIQHVLMKLLSYILFYHPDLEIEASVGQHYKPDLVRIDARGYVQQWIDCGSTTLKKLEQIARDNDEAIIKIVKPTEYELAMYKQQADERLPHPERVDYISFDNGYLDELDRLIHRRHELSAVVSTEYEHLYLSVDGQPTDSNIVYWHGGDGLVHT